MHTTNIKHTLNIFKQLYKQMPPLVPQEIRDDMKSALEQIENNFSLTLNELEDTIIVFGKQVWPYRQAFQEFVDVYKGRLGEKFLLQKMSSSLKRRYEDFEAHGGDFRALYSGGPLGFFSAEERIELCEVLVSVNKLVWEHVVQVVVSTERRDYEEKVIEFSQVLDDIEKRLDTLRQTADDEQEHPELAAEIREQVRSFEFGMSALGPSMNHFAVCQAEGFFAERKLEKNQHRTV